MTSSIIPGCLFIATIAPIIMRVGSQGRRWQYGQETRTRSTPYTRIFRFTIFPIFTKSR